MDKEEDLEILGEQLYSLIYPKHKESAAKLTGELTCMMHFIHYKLFPVTKT